MSLPDEYEEHVMPGGHVIIKAVRAEPAKGETPEDEWQRLDFECRVNHMDEDELRRRVLTQRDYLKRWAGCLDGIDLPVNINASFDGCRGHDDVRLIVERLADWKRRAEVAEAERNEARSLAERFREYVPAEKVVPLFVPWREDELADSLPTSDALKKRAEDAEAKAKVEADIADAYHEKWVQVLADSIPLSDVLPLVEALLSPEMNATLLPFRAAVALHNFVKAHPELHPSAKP